MHIDNFLFSTVLVLTVASIAVALSGRLGLGSVLGLLIAGIVVGPHTPGPVLTNQVEDLRHFTELGVVLLMFLIGLEMRPARLWSLRREVFGLGSLQILLSAALIAGLEIWMDIPWKQALLTGLTLALSSTAFVMQILRERGEIASRHGQAAFSVLLMQDLAVVPLLALVPLLAEQPDLASPSPWWREQGLVVGALALLWAFGRYLVPQSLEHLARQRNREGFLLVALLAVFLAAWAMQQVGLSMALGAFLMGMLLSSSRYHYQIEARVEPYKGLLMSLFFVAVGMSVEPAAILADPGYFLRQVLVILAVKLLVLFLLGLAFGLRVAGSLRLTSLLAQAGEFGFVLFGAAKVAHLIPDQTFVVAVSVISASLLVTPLLVSLGAAAAARLEPKLSGPRLPALTGEAPGDRPVILAGHGRVGHTVAVILKSTGIPFIAFDKDPERVAKGKADGFPVYFGDVSDPSLWDAAGVERAALVVMTIDQPLVTLRVVSHLRDAYPRVPVVSRARDLEACGHLLQAGAAYAFPEAVESSLRLGAQVLEMIGVPQENVDQLLHGVRQDDYALVSEAPGPDTAGGHPPH